MLLGIDRREPEVVGEVSAEVLVIQLVGELEEAERLGMDPVRLSPVRRWTV